MIYLAAPPCCFLLEQVIILKNQFTMSDEYDERHWLVAHLKEITTRRTKLLDFIHSSLPSRITIAIDSSLFFHASSVFTTVTLIVIVFARIRRITLFSMHPLCMIVGTLLCICQGVVAFRNRFLLESLSPIMQHNKRMKTRAIHQSMHIIGISFITLGFLFIVAHKVEMKRTLLPLTVHSFIGMCVLAVIGIQAISGIQKMEEFQKSDHPRKIRRWHGESGLMLWDLLSLALSTGSISLFGFLSKSTLVSLFCIGAVWLATHAQMRRKVPDDLGLLERVASIGDFGADDIGDDGGRSQSAEDP